MGGFWLSHLAISDRRNLQVRFHDDIDGSSLARAIYASTGRHGPPAFPFDSGFLTHSKPLGHDVSIPLLAPLDPRFPLRRISSRCARFFPRTASLGVVVLD